MTLADIISIEPLNWHAVLASLVCGTIIGLERQLRGKPVGIRTSSLIVLGTYAFVALSQSLNNDVNDPTRIIGQVVTGVGFLGAGVMLSKDGVVMGVTSAATIWVLAAVGVCIEVAGYLVAVKLSVLVVAILVGVDILENYSAALTRGVHSKITDWRRRR